MFYMCMFPKKIQLFSESYRMVENSISLSFQKLLYWSPNNAEMKNFQNVSLCYKTYNMKQKVDFLISYLKCIMAIMQAFSPTACFQILSFASV